MAKIRFEPSGYECEVSVGMRMQDLTDEHPDSEVPYSCRSASCGTCRVEVLKGSDAFGEMEEDEEEVLELFGEGDGVRLCCQLTVEKEVDEIALRVVDPY